MKATKKYSPEEVLNLAKVLAYKNIHIPKNLRGKIQICTDNDKVVIKPIA